MKLTGNAEVKVSCLDESSNKLLLNIKRINRPLICRSSWWRRLSNALQRSFKRLDYNNKAVTIPDWWDDCSSLAVLHTIYCICQLLKSSSPIRKPEVSNLFRHEGKFNSEVGNRGTSVCVEIWSWEEKMLKRKKIPGHFFQILMDLEHIRAVVTLHLNSMRFKWPC